MRALPRYLRQAAAKVAGALRLFLPRAPLGPTPCDVVYRRNKLRLLRYRQPAQVEPKDAPPILFVPSLINRHTILDLLPERSLVGYLAGQGYSVSIIDWGRPSAEDRYVTFDEIVDGALRGCVERTARAAGQTSATLIGYCMGGTLATILAALCPRRVANLICLAAPVDFSHAGLLGLWTERRSGFDVDLLVDALGNVPWPLLQASFHLLVPTASARKALYLYDSLADEEVVDGLVALETWGNDNVSFPGECYRRYIKDLYQQNLLVGGGLAINGRPVELERIVAPLLNIIAPADPIVPPAAAQPLSDRVGSTDVQTWELRGGHIGAIVGRSAARTFWPRLAGWLAAHRV